MGRWVDGSNARPIAMAIAASLFDSTHTMSARLATLSGFTTARASPLETSRAKVSARGVVRCDATKKSVGDLTKDDLADQVVFVRCDLNVPLDGDLNITDDTRIRAAVPTLEYLTKNGAKVLVTSHLVRVGWD